MDLNHEQQRRNRQADGTWALYSAHRERVTQTLLEARTQTADRLCLLGAGNLNDVELSALLMVFREIVLVDLDADALRRGLARQGYANEARIRVFAPADVTGAFTELTAMKRESNLEGAIEHCIQTLNHLPDFGWNGHADVVASVGLLTQLIDGVHQTIDESHPRSWELVSAIRTQHLRLMLELTDAGGAAVLVTEVVSSDSCPELLSVAESELTSLLKQVISLRNFFTGTNPAALLQLLQTDVRFADQLASARLSKPWRWTFLTRTYAAYAVTMRKRG